MDEEFQFLRALFNQPDDELRLVYADWLEDRGDARAEFLRLEVELQSLPKRSTRRKKLQQEMEKLRRHLDDNWLMRMSILRFHFGERRFDLARVNEGESRIEVRGDGEATLLVEGKPVAMNWDDCRGSVGQYLVFTGHTCGSEYARELRELTSGTIEDRLLAEQIKPLLRSFAPGVYLVAYTPKATDLGVCRYAEQVSELVNYYPYGRNLICTQTHDSLDAKQVTYYRTQIRKGRRPIVLTISAERAWCEFVIDGHHKLEAYELQETCPAVVSITRWNPHAISKEEGISYFPPRHRGIKEYRNMKR